MAKSHYLSLEAYGSAKKSWVDLVVRTPSSSAIKLPSASLYSMSCGTNPAENYYKPSDEYLLEQYARAVPDLTISQEEELRRTVHAQAVISDKKVGEIERENVSLQDRLAKLESSYGSLKEILEDVLLARTK